MDETHKASKDFYRRRAFARGGLPAHVVMNGPINRQFSILAAMGVDGAIPKDEICKIRRPVSPCKQTHAVSAGAQGC